MPIAAILLAAGSSSRLGRPKQLLEFHGESLIVRAIRLAKEAGLSPVIVVVQPAFGLPAAAATLDVVIVRNANAAEGMASSLRCGVEQASRSHVSGVVVLACDQPALTVDHLHQLIVQPEVRMGSAYAGRIGIPAYFPRQDFAALLELTGDKGARELLRASSSISNEELALDIDTEEDVRQARLRLG